MAGYELAQLNIAQMNSSIESPEMADFVANLDRINALADQAPGFVWRMQDMALGNAISLQPFGDDVLVNISVWRDIESLEHYVYKTAHVEILRRRKEWFGKMRAAHFVLWWITAGHRPTEAEAKAKLEQLQAQGATADAFTFAHPFPPPAQHHAPSAPQSTNQSILSTEQYNAQHAELDCYATPELVAAFIDDQFNAVQAVKNAAPAIAAVVDAASPRIHAGGRLLYMGAGTSGRLGLLDSVELHPTFSWDKARALACLAGGDSAVREAVEGAEDDAAQGSQDVLALRPTSNDVVLGIAASGRTPYVLGALQAARARGALTVAIVNNPDSIIANAAELAVVLDTGAEVISGSTRLKAGTAQKITLNTISSAIMVRQNKVYGNLMVDVRATNQKLLQRAENLTATIAGVSQEAARQALLGCNYHVKTAAVALRCNISLQDAIERLERCDGSVRAALQLD